MFKKDAKYFTEGSKEFYQRLILGILEANFFMVRHGVKFYQFIGGKIT